MKTIKTLILLITIVMISSINIYAQSETTLIVDSTETILIKVKGADCSNDLVRIASNVEKIEGVVSCTLVKEGLTSKFEVIYKPASVTNMDIYNAVENTGGCGNPDERPYTVKNK